MFTSFYLMMPIIAMYLVDTFQTDTSVVGMVVSAYIITALITRPFSGYLVDRFDRRKFYIISFLIYAIFFAGYIVSNSVGSILLTRILLGASFSLVTTAANTLSIDVIPSSRRAEGIGYYGAIVVLAMAFGPMLGLYLIDLLSFKQMFVFATIVAWLGLSLTFLIKTTPRESVVKPPLSWDRFFVRDGVSIAMLASLLYLFYGVLMAYIALFVREIGAEISSASFFLAFSIGIIFSRVLSGRLLRKSLHHELLLASMSVVIVAGVLMLLNISGVTFLLSSLLLGGGFGLSGPTLQSMIVDLVPASRRGTANSTYFVALDLGSGLGMLVGGAVASIWSFHTLYAISIGLVVVALLLYIFYSRQDYSKRLLQRQYEL